MTSSCSGLITAAVAELSSCAAPLPIAIRDGLDAVAVGELAPQLLRAQRRDSAAARAARRT